jgi:hypothetical protein
MGTGLNSKSEFANRPRKKNFFYFFDFLDFSVKNPHTHTQNPRNLPTIEAVPKPQFGIPRAPAASIRLTPPAIAALSATAAAWFAS